ncbi:MAG: QueT transporter family protein [Caldisericaceae bacterium]|nr:QueT transporter family protein [Caldisericaceae bacterium]
MNKGKIRFIARAGAIAALYVALTYLTYSFAYGEIQVRVSEALTVLPYIFPEAVWGVTIGCFIANIGSPFGPIDMIFGTSFTLIAALLTYWLGKTKKPAFLAPVPPILVNAFGVSFYVTTLLGLLNKNGQLTIQKSKAFSYVFTHFAFKPYIIGALWIGIGEAIATIALGLPLLYFFLRKRRSNES